MKLLIIALALGIAAAPKVAAGAEAKALELRPKAAIAAVAGSIPHQYSPFMAEAGERHELQLLPPPPRHHLERSRSSCENDNAVCYDARSGHIVYKPARALMPEIPGLQPENISVKRDKIVFRYTF
jgi:hypothetical protein